MTIKEARELLGEDAELLSDEELMKEIEVAELFKNIFFSKIKLWQK